MGTPISPAWMRKKFIRWRLQSQEAEDERSGCMSLCLQNCVLITKVQVQLESRTESQGPPAQQAQRARRAWRATVVYDDLLFIL